MQERSQESEESYLRLQFPSGWDEILTAPDAVDYQLWLENLTEITLQSCSRLDNPDPWMLDTAAIRNRWQRAIELVAAHGLYLVQDLTAVERIETALNIFKETIGANGWEKHGLVFELLPGQTIDLRNIEPFKEVDAYEQDI